MKKRIKLTDIAWAAGFFDGEGCSTRHYSSYKSKKGKPKNPNVCVGISVSQAELSPLKKFKKAVKNIGCINGPYQYKPNKRPYWVWSTSGKAAKKVFNILKPYLSTVKKKQFLIVSTEINRASNRKKGWIHDEK